MQQPAFLILCFAAKSSSKRTSSERRQAASRLTLLGLDDTVVVGHEEHGALEEVGLDQREVLKVLQCDWLNQQLPLLAVCPVRVDQLLRVRQKIEVVVLVHLE